MLTATFPSHAEMLEEFARGLREHKQKQTLEMLVRLGNLDAMARINATNFARSEERGTTAPPSAKQKEF